MNIAGRSSKQKQYPVGYDTPSRPMGTVDENGNIHGLRGRFVGTVRPEAEAAVIDGEGSFYWTPSFADATADEVVEFFEQVPVPDEALSRFFTAYWKAREAAPVDGLPEMLPPWLLRGLARATRMHDASEYMPETERGRLLDHQIRVDYGEGTDTVAGAVKHYRLDEISGALYPPEVDGVDRVAELERAVEQLTAKLTGQLAEMQEKMTAVQDTVDDVKDTVEDIEESVYATEHTTGLIDASVAPAGTYPDGSRAARRRERKH